MNNAPTTADSQKETKGTIKECEMHQLTSERTVLASSARSGISVENVNPKPIPEPQRGGIGSGVKVYTALTELAKIIGAVGFYKDVTPGGVQAGAQGFRVKVSKGCASSLFIIAAWAFGLGSAVAYDAPQIKAQMRITQVDTAAHAFEATYGILPPETNWFAELTATTNSYLNRQKIVFLQASSADDPWGHRLIYHCPGKHNTSGPDVSSLGKDGRSSSGGDDPDDINNWNPASPWNRYYSGFHIPWPLVTGLAGCLLILLAIFWLIPRRIKPDTIRVHP